MKKIGLSGYRKVYTRPEWQRKCPKLSLDIYKKVQIPSSGSKWVQNYDLFDRFTSKLDQNEYQRSKIMSLCLI